MDIVCVCASIGRVRRLNLSLLICLLLLICIFILSGCASLSNKKDILAIVDDEPVTTEDLEYSLEIAHRVEDMSSAKTFDITHYIHKIIDERLVIHEAGRMGMADYPDVKKKIQDYIVRESVVLLHDEEVLKKVTVKEDEIMRVYMRDYETFIIDVIAVETEDDAANILEKLAGGAQFSELSEEHPSKMQNKGEKGFLFKRKELGPAVRDTISELPIGEYTEAIKDRGQYIIIMLVERQPADIEGVAGAKRSIKSSIREEKIKKREKEYLAELREKAEININEEILSAIKVDGDVEERKRWVHDSRPIVEVNGEILTTGDFTAMLSPATMKIKEKILDAWLDNKVVDHEALSRHYELELPLKSNLHRYRNNLLQNAFTSRVIVPRVRMTEDDVREYYVNNQREYIKPERLKLQQITLKSRDEAENVLSSLRGGANFVWLVKKKSTDNYASKGGVMGWKTVDELEVELRNAAAALNPGDISEVIEKGPVFIILRLQEKSGDEFMEYEKVKPRVQQKVFKKKFDEIYSDYISTLKKQADVKINDSAIKAYKDIFNQ